MILRSMMSFGGGYRNRTGVHGFAIEVHRINNNIINYIIRNISLCVPFCVHNSVFFKENSKDLASVG
jgi:hypothetical protein